MPSFRFNKSQIKGVVFEEFVLRLLAKAGYRIIEDSNSAYDIRNGHNGLQLQGRGEWHQTDALVAYDHTPAFIYPIRLIVEAKAYSLSFNNKGKIGINVVRNAVGVLKDVNENYFAHIGHDDDDSYKLKRFNYAYAVFSLNGFTENAQRYALAHQIFLIQYHYSTLFEAVRYIFQEYDKTDIKYEYDQSDIKSLRLEDNLTAFRRRIRDYFATENDDGGGDYIHLYPEVIRRLLTQLKKELSTIRGSYFGLLNGEYPIHLLSMRDIGDVDDEIYVQVHLEEPGLVRLELNGIASLFFELPEYVARIFQSVWNDRGKLANEKSRYIKYISLTGRFAKKQRNIILKLDKDWLSQYISMLRNG